MRNSLPAWCGRMLASRGDSQWPGPEDLDGAGFRFERPRGRRPARRGSFGSRSCETPLGENGRHRGQSVLGSMMGSGDEL